MSFYKQFLSNVYLKSKEVEHLKIDGVFHSFTFPIMGIPDAAAKLLQSCLTLCSPLDSSPPGPLSLGFSRPEHWSGLPFPSPQHESEK